MKRVLVIGGINDLGKCFVNYFLDKDYQVFLGYHNKLDDTNELVNYVKCDVTDENSIENMIKDIVLLHGKIDIMINLSCICIDNLLTNMSKDDFMKVLEVNTVGTFITNKVYSKYHDDGLIINISSTDGIDTYNKYNMNYAVSKAGIITLTKCMSLSTSNKVICLCPNWINTESTRNIDESYLMEEMNRIKQDRLIEPNEVISAMDKILTGDYKTGYIYRIDIKEGLLWVEKM